jgi:hypothetical protein
MRDRCRTAQGANHGFLHFCCTGDAIGTTEYETDTDGEEENNGTATKTLAKKKACNRVFADASSVCSIAARVHIQPWLSGDLFHPDADPFHTDADLFHTDADLFHPDADLLSSQSHFYSTHQHRSSSRVNVQPPC